MPYYGMCTVKASLDLWDDCGAALWHQAKKGEDVCDVKVMFDDKTTMKAHWCILLRCPYIQALYDSGLQEKTTGVIKFDYVIAAVARLAFEFIYLGTIEVKVDQFSDLIEVADYLQLESLRDACVSALCGCKSVVLNDCLQFYAIAKKYDIEKLLKLSEKHILADVGGLMEEDHLYQLSAEFLKDMFQNPALKTIPRESLFKLLIRWLEKSNENVQHFPELFSYLDLKEMPADALEKVKDNKFVLGNVEVKKRVQAHLRLLKSGKLDVTEKKDVLLFKAMQEYDKENKVHFYAFVIDENRWTQFAYLSKRKVEGHLAVIEDSLYYCGPQSPVFRRFGDISEDVLLYELRPTEVKRAWNDISFDKTDYRTYQLHAFAATSIGGLVSIREDYKKRIQLKVDQPSFVKWCAEKGGKSKKVKVPEAQMTSMSHDLMAVPASRFGGHCPTTAHMVCFEQYVFIYLAFKHIMRKSTYEHYYFVYNLEDKTVKKVAPPAKPLVPSVAYLRNNRVYLESLRCKYKRRPVFDFASMAFVVETRELLPVLNVKPRPSEETLVYHDGDLFVLALTGGKKTSVNTLYKLNSQLGSWEELSKFPLSPGLNDTEGIGWKVDKFKLRCPVDCHECQKKLDENCHLLLRKENAEDIIEEPHS